LPERDFKMPSRGLNIRGSELGGIIISSPAQPGMGEISINLSEEDVGDALSITEGYVRSVCELGITGCKAYSTSMRTSDELGDKLVEIGYVCNKSNCPSLDKLHDA
jgi:hypothetical protein